MNITNDNRATPNKNVFNALRALTPNHVLTFGEAVQRAELQATLPAVTRPGVLT